MAKFKIGDLAVVVNNFTYEEAIFLKGEIAKIIGKRDRHDADFDVYITEWKTWNYKKRSVSGHDASGMGKIGHCWNIPMTTIDNNMKISINDDDISEERKQQIITAIAKRGHLIKNFKGIRVFADRKMPLAFVNIETEEIFINMDSDFMPFDKMLSHIDALIVHEQGHLDKRLLAPTDLKTALSYQRILKKKNVDKVILNFVLDMEIHFQYNKSRMIKPMQSLKLKHFLTQVRNMAYEEDKSDLILSLEYPTTDEQKQTKAIMENRQLTIVEKAERISKIIKKSGKDAPSMTAITEVYIPETKSKVKPNAVSKAMRKIGETADDITTDIINEGKAGEIKEKLAGMGFSDIEISDLLKREDRGDLMDNIENLEKSMAQMLVIDQCEARERTHDRIESHGHRFNGYHKIRDFKEAVENVEELVTTGKYDFNDMMIPTKVSRKNMGIMLILRDTSGSIGSGNLAKVVRDATVGLIKIAKDGGHKVAIVDFHSQPEPVLDSKGNLFSMEYNRILLDSMNFKCGYSTIISKAIEYVNKMVTEKRMDEVPLNVFIISDGQIEDRIAKQWASKKVNVIGICAQEREGRIGYDDIPRKFTTLIEKYKGRLFVISKETSKFWTEMLKDYRCN
jgi:Mg-chelatase subunit ChlD